MKIKMKITYIYFHISEYENTPRERRRVARKMQGESCMVHINHSYHFARLFIVTYFSTINVH
jgi:hypothetical protein